MTGAASLAALVRELAATLPDARAAATTAGTDWARGGVVFAALAGEALEVRLDGPVATAALKTPDTSESLRGRPWVRFAPALLDGHAIDRASAWLGLAYRLAGQT